MRAASGAGTAVSQYPAAGLGPCGAWRGVLQKQQRQEQQERPVIARKVELLCGAVGRDKPVWVDDPVARDLDAKLLAGRTAFPLQCDVARHELP